MSEYHEDDDGLWTELASRAPSAEMKQLLLASLRHPDREVRREALDSLWEVLDDELATVALDLARHDPDPEIRAFAAISLGPGLDERSTWDQSEGEPVLSQEAFDRIKAGLRSLYHASEAPTEVRRRALEAAVRAPEPWHEGAIRAAYASDDVDWRVTAVFCMGHVAGFAPEILEALFDRHDGVRFEAARAAAGVEDPRVGRRVLALALDRDEDEAVRFVAVESLQWLNVPGARAALADLAHDPSEQVREAALEAALFLEARDEVEGDVDWEPDEDEEG